MRVPKHIAIIPDGNRRWALANGFTKEKGYKFGLTPGIDMLKVCKAIGVKELTYYGFTMDNTKRPSLQREAFTNACIEAIDIIAKEDSELLVVGNSSSEMFPKELLPYTKRTTFGKGDIKVNFLVNYGWEWDLGDLKNGNEKGVARNIKSKEISRIDLIIRWGGRRRLSGLLPVQAVYADFYIIDDFWPDFKENQIYEAIKWYSNQDVTLGG